MLGFTALRSYTKAAHMRVYVPLTLSVLASVNERREVGPAPLAAYAVTPALRERRATDDMEELEYEALGRAAHASLRLLAAERPREPAESRRVVVAVDVDEDWVTGDPEGEVAPDSVGAVRLGRPVPLSKVAAFHVDDTDATGDVHAACVALASAGGGDGGGGEARKAVDEADDHELLWYATQELAYLL